MQLPHPNNPSPYDIWIAHRGDNPTDAKGTASDPYDGNPAHPQRGFDWAMGQIYAAVGTTPVTIHVGPGTFKTKGYSDSTPTAGWQAHANTRLIWSAMTCHRFGRRGDWSPKQDRVQ